MKLNIFKQTKVRVPRRQIESLFNKVIQTESKKGNKGQINLIMTTDSKLRKLNSQFRGIDSVTDVLSFNLDQPEDMDSIFGEIYIAIPTAFRQAKQYDTTLSEELLRLTCHGFLHLFGYDHQTTSQRQKMQSLEEQYLLAVGGQYHA